MRAEILYAIMTDPNMRLAIEQAASTRELVAEYDRLNGSNLSLQGTPIELAIDEATGRTSGEIEAFIEFVYDAIYRRVQW